MKAKKQGNHREPLAYLDNMLRMQDDNEAGMEYDLTVGAMG